MVVLSVLLTFTNYDYPFGIFKLNLCITTLDKLCTITICTFIIKEETALEQLKILMTVRCT